MFENRERNADYKFIGIDQKEYCEIAEMRINLRFKQYEYDFNFNRTKRNGKKWTVKTVLEKRGLMKLYSNEIVFRGHPDKVCDQISGAI